MAVEIGASPCMVESDQKYYRSITYYVKSRTSIRKMVKTKRKRVFLWGRKSTKLVTRQSFGHRLFKEVQKTNAGTKGTVVTKNRGLFPAACSLGPHRGLCFRQLWREWGSFVYQEAGKYNGAIMIRDSNAKQASLTAPAVSKTTEIQVTPKGDPEPDLYRYRRAVVTLRH